MGKQCDGYQVSGDGERKMGEEEDEEEEEEDEEEEDDTSDNDILDVRGPSITDGLKEFARQNQPVSGGTRSAKNRSCDVDRIVLKNQEKSNKLLLVYPFHAKKSELNKAAIGMKELRGDLLGIEDQGTPSNPMIISSPNISMRKGRKQYTTIREEDKEMLNIRNWYNDALVSFWMLW